MTRLPAWFRPFIGLSPRQQQILLTQLNEGHRDELLARWALWAHRGQLPGDDDWRVWLIRAGRGFGNPVTSLTSVTPALCRGPTVQPCLRSEWSRAARFTSPDAVSTRGRLGPGPRPG